LLKGLLLKILAKKFVVAMMMHETNTFSPLPTPIESFVRAGAIGGAAAIKEAEGTNTSLGGFIEVARKADAEFTVPMAASAHPSGHGHRRRGQERLRRRAARPARRHGRGTVRRR
jgi:microcystin degradation protein MlrC